jgi:hypothetical protein
MRAREEFVGSTVVDKYVSYNEISGLRKPTAKAAQQGLWVAHPWRGSMHLGVIHQ